MTAICSGFSGQPGERLLSLLDEAKMEMARVRALYELEDDALLRVCRR